MRFLVVKFRQSWRLVLLLVHLGVGVGVAITIQAARLVGRSSQIRPKMAAWWHGRFCRILRLDLRIHGEFQPGGALVVANHTTWIDIPVLGAATGGDFLSKAEISGWPVFGAMARWGGTLFIQRGAHGASSISEQMAERMQQGHAVILFPEGTTTEGCKLRPFYPRLFGASRKSGLPVQPIAIAFPHHGGIHPAVPWVDQPLPKNLFGILALERLAVEVTFCPALDPQTMDRRALATASREAVRLALGHSE